MRKKHTATFKAKIALEAIKGEKTISEIASEHGIHPQQVRSWKRKFLKKAHLVFIAPSPRTTKTIKTHYDNLLKTTPATYPNKIWCADITYVRTKGGFAYGVAIMDL